MEVLLFVILMLIGVVPCLCVVNHYRNKRLKQRSEALMSAMDHGLIKDTEELFDYLGGRPKSDAVICKNKRANAMVWFLFGLTYLIKNIIEGSLRLSDGSAFFDEYDGLRYVVAVTCMCYGAVRYIMNRKSSAQNID